MHAFAAISKQQAEGRWLVRQYQQAEGPISEEWRQLTEHRFEVRPSRMPWQYPRRPPHEEKLGPINEPLSNPVIAGRKAKRVTPLILIELPPGRVIERRHCVAPIWMPAIGHRLALQIAGNIVQKGVGFGFFV